MSKIGDISAVSFSHKNTTLEERDQLALSSAEVEAWLPTLGQQLSGELAIISTCNRTEVYFHGDPNLELWPRLKPLLCEHRGIELKRCPEPVRYRSTDAARHLFRVSSSLESLALGENQILGQVKTAHELLLKTPEKSPVLDRLFQYAVRAGKNVRTRTNLCDGAVSISSASVDLAKRLFGDFQERQVLLVGAGETATNAGVHFRGAGATRFVIANRSEETGRAVAEKFGGTYRTLDELPQALLEADIAVFATGAKEHLLERKTLKPLMKKRSYRQLFIIDISNPRNVAPDVAKQDGVFLYNIDHLKKVVEANLQGRAQEIPKAEECVEELIVEWGAWMQERRIRPAIASLSRFFNEISQQELSRDQNRISDDERQMLEEYSRRLIKKLLHHPISYLRQSVQTNSLRTEDLNLVLALYNLHDRDETSDE